MAKNEKYGGNGFSGETVIRFEDVSFEYGHNKSILNEVNFNVRRGSKITLMGQNGAGKSTLFGLILGELKPESGEVHITKGSTIATARQVIPREQLHLTVREFFATCFAEKKYDLDPRIDEILDVVNLHTPKATPTHPVMDYKDRELKTFSGGQQARILLASALIQDPDILLLDEPTNNLDSAGIEHLTQFLIDYKKSCIVISHDAEFLNAFTHGVLYLDVHTRTIEQYVGNYKDVVEEISTRIEKENMENARLGKEIQAKKDQANMFAMKGGNLRLVAKRMREKAEELEAEKIDVRQEDRAIKPFTIPAQPEIIGDILTMTSYASISLKTHKFVTKNCSVKLRRKQHLLISGPNGIGKSTLLEKILSDGPLSQNGITIAPGIRIGYYRQDFSMMDFNDSVYESLEKIVRATEGRLIETELRAAAASFLIGADVIHTRIGSLSEGQKGLVAFARLVLQKPGILILDEPTNHINFRHLPIIAKALDKYEGAMILVSHVPEFVKQIRIDYTLEMGK